VTAFYTYFTSYLTTVTRLDGAFVGIAFFVWGVSAVVGLFRGGTLSDRFGSRAVMIPAFTFLTLSFLALSATGHYLSGTNALAPITVAIVIWGLAAWAFFPAQQSQLMQVAGPKTAALALSLNASFMYLGFSLGAMLGSLILMHAAVTTSRRRLRDRGRSNRSANGALARHRYRQVRTKGSMMGWVVAVATLTSMNGGDFAALMEARIRHTEAAKQRVIEHRPDQPPPQWTGPL
jgi:MFS family permease